MEIGSPSRGRGYQRFVYELEQLSESLVLRSLGRQPLSVAGEWREAPLMGGLERLIREIGTYLEFVAIARGV